MYQLSGCSEKGLGLAKRRYYTPRCRWPLTHAKAVMGHAFSLITVDTHALGLLHPEPGHRDGGLIRLSRECCKPLVAGFNCGNARRGQMRHVLEWQLLYP
mgnify:CR=1 FL=1